MVSVAFCNHLYDSVSWATAPSGWWGVASFSGHDDVVTSDEPVLKITHANAMNVSLNFRRYNSFKSKHFLWDDLLFLSFRQRLPAKNVYYYRCPDHRRNYVMSFAFCFDREDDVYQFAYCYPYTYSRLQHYLASLERRHLPYLQRELLGLSVVSDTSTRRSSRHSNRTGCIVGGASSLVCSYQIIVGEKLIRNAWEITALLLPSNICKRRACLRDSAGIFVNKQVTTKYSRCSERGRQIHKSSPLLIKCLVTYSRNHNRHKARGDLQV